MPTLAVPFFSSHENNVHCSDIEPKVSGSQTHKMGTQTNKSSKLTVCSICGMHSKHNGKHKHRDGETNLSSNSHTAKTAPTVEAQQLSNKIQTFSSRCSPKKQSIIWKGIGTIGGTSNHTGDIPARNRIKKKQNCKATHQTNRSKKHENLPEGTQHVGPNYHKGELNETNNNHVYRNIETYRTFKTNGMIKIFTQRG